MNMLSLWLMASLEARVSSIVYVKYTLLLVLGTSACMVAAGWLLLRYKPAWLGLTNGAGYSGVLFGWLMLYAMMDPRGSTSVFGLAVPNLRAALRIPLRHAAAHPSRVVHWAPERHNHRTAHPPRPVPLLGPLPPPHRPPLAAPRLPVERQTALHLPSAVAGRRLSPHSHRAESETDSWCTQRERGKGRGTELQDNSPSHRRTVSAPAACAHEQLRTHWTIHRLSHALAYRLHLWNVSLFISPLLCALRRCVKEVLQWCLRVVPEEVV